MKATIIDPQTIEQIRERSRDLCEDWLDRIQEEGQKTGDYNTVLCVYLSAAKFLIDKTEASLKSIGGNLIHEADTKNIKKEGN